MKSLKAASTCLEVGIESTLCVNLAWPVKNALKFYGSFYLWPQCSTSTKKHPFSQHPTSLSPLFNIGNGKHIKKSETGDSQCCSPKIFSVPSFPFYKIQWVSSFLDSINDLGYSSYISVDTNLGTKCTLKVILWYMVNYWCNLNKVPISENSKKFK